MAVNNVFAWSVTMRDYAPYTICSHEPKVKTHQLRTQQPVSV